MLTNAVVKAARSRSRAYKMFDERGLHLHVATSGRATWRIKYRLAGAEQLLTIGCYPEISLNSARQHLDQARQQIARGIKPASPAAAKAVLMTFEQVARSWHARKQSGWAQAHAADVLTSLERDVFAPIGAFPCDEISASNVRELLEVVEARGRIETARRLRQRIEAIFAFAISHDQATANPAKPVAAALAAAPRKRRQPALLTIADARELLAACDRAPGRPIVRLASRFLALTAVRLDALRGARWSEIEDLDGPAPLWRVPAARMKLARVKKDDAAFDHQVPLAPAAVEILRVARAFGHGGELIFPGTRSDLPFAEGAIGDLYDRAGYAGRHVPHGWRATFSTIMNEALPAERGVIDRILGHALKSDDGRAAKVEAAYNRSEQLDPRRIVLEKWAALLIGG
ncbi:tyrosine-type recombinase/integrase [Sphingomonas sp. BAUL-RG-20F-R05-02]|uniref:tyrosine-type recombinase/integrase n=1 Tax=Sphingomonas sp. BAUL-RG-20F-R05-02 TaxID=2914830 RepID=UPI001F5925B4|nr:integrase arm-type DNA-binding domain-containing protein [Sphingomonas sp. BAUL-RG-20F-R05-02]